jgi:hypothetical protein
MATRTETSVVYAAGVVLGIALVARPASPASLHRLPGQSAP